MTKYFCDLCRRDVTEEDTSAIKGILVAHEDGSGEISEDFPHICKSCYRIWRDWMRDQPLLCGEANPVGLPAPTKRRRRA